MANIQIDLNTELLHGLFSKDGKDEAFSKLLEVILNQVLLHQASEQLGAKSYERSSNRSDYRNGTRNRNLTTRIGTITLDVPRFRSGEFSTSLFSRYQRSEQALVLSLIEMVINGVSTRKVKAVTEELCGTSISKSTVSSLCKKLDPAISKFRNRPLSNHYPFLIVDAIYVKVRKDSRVISTGLLIVTGVNIDGNREALGFAHADSESESSWGDLFYSLKSRGLKNVDLIVSDNHTGLVNAAKKHFQGSSWQRCQTHFSRNILDATPKRLKSGLKTQLQILYSSPDMEKAITTKNEIIESFEEKAPKAIAILEKGFEDVCAILTLPERYRKRLRTSNSIERLNEEIRRRERVIRIFPNENSLIRLIGALLVEQHEKWSTGKKYFVMDDYLEFLKIKKMKQKTKVA
jgi:transposase-like protein